jgi:hypothetical protein
MQTVGRIGGLGVVFALVFLATSGPAAARPKPISGKLTKPGYTVVALAANGKSKVVRASRGKFRLSPPARRVTLHLRAPNGTYAGPTVVGRRKKGRRAIVGVKAGARLGRIKVLRGYARVSKQLRRKWVDASNTARARRGVPIGARNFGHVRSKPPRRPIPADLDLDGVPNRLDVDDDGDLVLDDADRASAARAADHEPGHPPPPSFGVLSTLGPPPSAAVNANPRHRTDPGRPAFTDAEIDDALKSFGGLIFGAEGAPGSPSPELSELDCGGDPKANPPKPALVYCSNPNSTGKAPPPAAPRPTAACRPATAPYPGDPAGAFDPDGDGLGALLPFDGCPSLFHGATSTEIKTGDFLIQRGKDANGVEVAFTTTLQYVFATVPALVSYRDTTMVAPATLSYPHDPAAGPDLPVSAPSGQDVAVTLTFWRPQRRRIPNDPEPQSGESATWTDSGGRDYGIGTAGLVGPCPQSAFSDPKSEPVPNVLTLPPPGPPGSQGPVQGGGGFRDLALDQPANPNNRLTFTLNITECLRSGGRESLFDQSGETLLLQLRAFVQGGGSADQTLSFRRQ